MGGKRMHLSLKATFAGTYIRLEAALLSLQENQPPPKMQSFDLCTPSVCRHVTGKPVGSDRLLKIDSLGLNFKLTATPKFFMPPGSHVVRESDAALSFRQRPHGANSPGRPPPNACAAGRLRSPKFGRGRTGANASRARRTLSCNKTLHLQCSPVTGTPKDRPHFPSSLETSSSNPKSEKSLIKLSTSFYSGTTSFWPQKIPHPHVTSSPHAEMDPSLHWKLFLETIAADAWLLTPISSWPTYGYREPSLISKPEEVYIYSSLLRGVLSTLSSQSSSPHSLLRPCSAGSSQRESNVHKPIEEKGGNEGSPPVRWQTSGFSSGSSVPAGAT
ncbi:uncharacterized protein [Manis javanica]|uniref:uncharacterized protein n=1 Tax=Manis javanica TaxID=9974 RepID=UPI003C6CE065